MHCSDSFCVFLPCNKTQQTNMRKITLLLLLVVLLVTAGSCGDDDEKIDTKLIKGQWELTSGSDATSPYIYSFATQGESTWSWGQLTTYYLTAQGGRVNDKVYDWHVSDPDNDTQVYLDITYKGDINGVDPWENDDRYVVEKLTATTMVLRKWENGDSKTTLTFKRRNDLK